MVGQNTKLIYISWIIPSVIKDKETWRS